jgi:hypothetical protein
MRQEDPFSLQIFQLHLRHPPHTYIASFVQISLSFGLKFRSALLHYLIEPSHFRRQSSEIFYTATLTPLPRIISPSEQFKNHSICSFCLDPCFAATLFSMAAVA